MHSNPKPWYLVQSAWALPAIGLLVACQSTPRSAAPVDSDPPSNLEGRVGQLADELVRDAELRTNLSTMRVFVNPLEGSLAKSTTQTVSSSSDEEQAERLAEELEAELVLAFSSELHLIDASLAEGRQASEAAGSAVEVARETGATHVVLGTYKQLGDQLVLTVRLVDTEGLVIVAASRASFPVRLLSEGVRPESPVRIAKSPSRRVNPAAPLVSKSSSSQAEDSSQRVAPLVRGSRLAQDSREVATSQWSQPTETSNSASYAKVIPKQVSPSKTAPSTATKRQRGGRVTGTRSGTGLPSRRRAQPARAEEAEDWIRVLTERYDPDRDK